MVKSKSHQNFYNLLDVCQAFLTPGRLWQWQRGSWRVQIIWTYWRCFTVNHTIICIFYLSSRQEECLLYCVQNVAPGNSWQWHDDISAICFQEAHFRPFGDRARWGWPSEQPFHLLCWLTANRDIGCNSKWSTCCTRTYTPKAWGLMWQHRPYLVKVDPVGIVAF